MWWEGVEENSRQNTVVCEQGSELGLYCHRGETGLIGLCSSFEVC